MGEKKTFTGHIKFVRPQVLAIDTLVIEKDNKHNLRWREIFFWNSSLGMLKTIPPFLPEGTLIPSPSASEPTNILSPVFVTAFDYIEKRQQAATYHIKQDVITREVGTKIMKHDLQKSVKAVVVPIVDHSGTVLSFCVTELIF